MRSRFVYNKDTGKACKNNLEVDIYDETSLCSPHFVLPVGSCFGFLAGSLRKDG